MSGKWKQHSGGVGGFGSGGVQVQQNGSGGGGYNSLFDPGPIPVPGPKFQVHHVNQGHSGNQALMVGAPGSLD